MARIRTIKPEFWKHEALSELPEATHILAAALLNYADDEGFFNANPKLVQAECSPLREPSVSTPESLRSLQEVGYIRLGTHAGKRYGQIVHFTDHQKISHPAKSKISCFSIAWECSGDSPEKLQSTPETLRPEQGTGNREQGREPPSVSAPCAPSPPVDLKSQIFGPCLGWLAKQTGKSSQSLRSAVGRWCRDYGDGPVVEALMAAQRTSPVEPVGYIERLLKSGGPRDGPHSRERQEALEAQVDQMISEAAERADAQHEQADYGPVGEAEFGFRSPDAEDGRQRSKPEVRGAGGGLRRISAALPSVGTGGGR